MLATWPVQDDGVTKMEFQYITRSLLHLPVCSVASQSSLRRQIGRTSREDHTDGILVVCALQCFIFTQSTAKPPHNEQLAKGHYK